MLFSSTYKVRMGDTDMAGLLYFAQQFHFVHGTVEDFLEKIGLPIHQMFYENPFVFVIAHAQADYHLPLKVGDLLTIEMSIKEVGYSSFHSHFNIKRAEELVGKAEIIYVCLDRLERKKTEIPAAFKKRLLNQ